MAKAISNCHNSGVVHRDIKLENVMIHSDFSIILIDFGYGKVIKNEKKLNRYCGTPYYMPPEMISGNSYDGKK